MSISQKLQQNLDVVRFLVKNASPEQLAWRPDSTARSLRQIIEQLCTKEKAHVAFLNKLTHHHLSQTLDQGLAHPFDTFALYRNHLISGLQNIKSSQKETKLAHPQFGQITVAQLIIQIDTADQRAIHHLELLIQAMPLNPQITRAMHEISTYHQQYQPYLAKASTLLDIGVGTGLALNHLLQSEPHLTFFGVDVRDLRLPHLNVPLQLYQGDILPFDTQQFDVSLLFYVLHHCQNPQQLLTEAVRVTDQTLIIIEEFDLPHADNTSLDLTERQNHFALGLPTDLPYQLFDKPNFEAMLTTHHLTLLAQQSLPSKTTRPIQKYLYILEIP